MPVALQEPAAAFGRIFRTRARLDERYMFLGPSVVDNAAARISAIELITQSAVLLEALLVSACALEIAELRTQEIDSANLDVERDVLPVVQRRTKLDPFAVMREFSRVFAVGQSSNHGPDISLASALRSIRSSVAMCPIDQLQEIANEQGLQALGHRCRVAYEGLRAWTLRVDPQQRESIRVLGEAYEMGAISPAEVAIVLDCSVADAVALLEEHEYARPLDTIRLEQESRDMMLRALRADRLVRAGEWVTPSPALTIRNVVASERIEGVDARAWL